MQHEQEKGELQENEKVLFLTLSGGYNNILFSFIL